MPLRRLVLGAPALALLLASAPLARPAAAEDAGTAGYQQVVDLTFPTDERVTYTDSYDAARGEGRAHKAADLMGEKHWEVRAAIGGTVTWIPGADGSAMPAYGYMIRIAGDDGRTYSYVHLDNDSEGTDDGRGGPERAYAPGLEEGSTVERGQLIGFMGDSGNAEGSSPHLHFEIEDPDVVDPYGSHRIDPIPSLDAARERGDFGSGTRTSDAGGACPADRVPEAGYDDVAADHPHRAAIDCSTWWEVVTGTAPGRYEPARGL